MQPVINNQQLARIHQQPEITQEPVEANFSNLGLKFMAAGTVANYVTKDNAGKLPIPKLLQRNVQTLAEFKSHQIVQQLINKTINAFNARDYKTLQTFFELGCCKLTEDQLETLVQENISKSDSYVLEEGGEEFISIARAFKYCDSWGAKVTQEQLDNCLEKAISVIDGSAIRLLLRLGATRPSMESLNQLLKEYIIQDHHSIDFVKLNSVQWRNIIGELSIDTNNFLNQKQQEAINNGDYIAIHKINSFLQNDLTQDELNQAFQTIFNNGYTDSKQFEYLCKLLDMGAIANDNQIDLIIKENTLHDKLPLDGFFYSANLSQKIDILYKLVNFDLSFTISSNQMEKIIYLLNLIRANVITNEEELTNDKLEKCIEKSLDLGLSLVTNFFLSVKNCKKKLTQEQLNYGLEQNLKLFQAENDVRKWLDMGSSIQVFKQCFEESLQDNNLLKILNLFDASQKIEQFNHILTNQTYIDTAVKKGISQLKSIDLKHNDTGVSFIRYSDNSGNEFSELTPIGTRYESYTHHTIPGYFISTLLKRTLAYRQIEQINELLPLLIETAIDKLEFENIDFLVHEINYALSDEQRDKIKLNLLSQGIPSYTHRGYVPNRLIRLNITFTQEELNTGYVKALQDSHSTFKIWKSIGAKPIFEKTDQ
jgi:hypothetical protein